MQPISRSKIFDLRTLLKIQLIPNMILLLYVISMDVRNWSEDMLPQNYQMKVAHSLESFTVFIFTVFNLLYISISKESFTLTSRYTKLMIGLSFVGISMESLYLEDARTPEAKATNPSAASLSQRHGIKIIFILITVLHFAWLLRYKAVLNRRKPYQPISSKRYFFGFYVKYWMYLDALTNIRFLASFVINIQHSLSNETISGNSRLFQIFSEIVIYSVSAFSTYSVFKRDRKKLQYSFWMRFVAMLLYMLSVTLPGAGDRDPILRRAVFTRGILPEVYSKLFTTLVWLPLLRVHSVIILVCIREYIEQLEAEENVQNNTLAVVPTNFLYSESDQVLNKKVWKSQMKLLEKEDRKVIRQCNLNPRYLNIDPSNCLGIGEFGPVYKGNMGRFSKQVVAVKMARVKMDKEYISNLLFQFRKLIPIGTHKNIVRFYGFFRLSTSQYGNFGVVMEYCENGSMLNYLQRLRQQNLPGDAITEELYRFAYETAQGLEYLSIQKVIHGDVACRNLLLSGDKTVKISDFGMSLKLYKSEEYARSNQQIFPWKWMAPEALIDLKFSIQSDVWSYGVLLWELYTLGSDPYPGVAWTSNFVTDLKNGSRLEKPELASEEMFEIMNSCWKHEPVGRITFPEIIQNLHTPHLVS